MGHIPCKKRITYPSQENTRIAYLLQHKIYNTWALYFFGKAYDGITRCAKFLLEKLKEIFRTKGNFQELWSNAAD